MHPFLGACRPSPPLPQAYPLLRGASPLLRGLPSLPSLTTSLSVAFYRLKFALPAPHVFPAISYILFAAMSVAADVQCVLCEMRAGMDSRVADGDFWTYLTDPHSGFWYRVCPCCVVNEQMVNGSGYRQRGALADVADALLARCRRGAIATVGQDTKRRRV